MIGKIESISSGFSKNGKYQIWRLVISGNKYSTLEDCSEFNVGDTVQARVTQKGSYQNLTQMQLAISSGSIMSLSKPHEPPKQPLNQSELPTTILSVERQIVRQNVLNRATELYLAGHMEADGKTGLQAICVMAGFLEKWVRGEKDAKDPVR